MEGVAHLGPFIVLFSDDEDTALPIKRNQKPAGAVGRAFASFCLFGGFEITVFTGFTGYSERCSISID